jgi:hypothetical protein
MLNKPKNNSMEKSKMSREEKDDLYNKMIASHPDAVRKGDTIPYTSLNGNMYSFLAKGDFVGLRLPEEERIKFMGKYKTGLVEQYGVVQKEYVVVPDSLLKKTNELKPYFVLSHIYTGSLRPKPTTKGKNKPATKSTNKPTTKGNNGPASKTKKKK